MTLQEITAKHERKERITTDDLIQLTDIDLMQFKLNLNRSSASVSQQLQDAESNATQFGEHPDPEWLRRASSAKRAFGFLDQMIQVQLTIRRRARGAEQEQSYTRKLRGAVLATVDAAIADEIFQKATV